MNLLFNLKGKLTQGKLTQGKLTQGKLTQGKLTQTNNNMSIKNTYVNDNIITFVTCWYVMKSKFSPEKYLIWIKNLLSIVKNFNLVIYTDVKSLKLLFPLINNNERIKVIIKSITNFYTYKYKENWIKNHESSNMDLHKHTDWKLNMLWNEKVFFVEDVIKNRYFNSIYYGWCDIGYFRNGPDDLHTTYLSNWPNQLKMLQNPYNKMLIHYGCIQNQPYEYNLLINDILEHYSNKSLLKSPPTNKYGSVCFAGGFFILKPELIEHYVSLYDKKLKYYFDNKYFIKDDQMIVMDIIFTNKNLFCIHKEENPQFNNWFMFQRLLL